MRLTQVMLVFTMSQLLLVSGAKDKTVKKRPVAVPDPWSLRRFADWVTLGESVLQKSCIAANLSPNGPLTSLARSLLTFYQHLSPAEQGKRVSFFGRYAWTWIAPGTW